MNNALPTPIPGRAVHGRAVYGRGASGGVSPPLKFTVDPRAAVLVSSSPSSPFTVDPRASTLVS